MGRQLFLHHYLPAHLASCLVTGALVEFIFNVEPVIDDSALQNSISPSQSTQKSSASMPSAVKEKQEGPRSRKHFQTASERLKGQSMLATWIATIVILAVVLYGFMFFFPLTYGWPGLDVQQVNRRKWLGYDLHFAK
jgi:dolichyl-phosphate-mannose-protein mannosyltransferase